MIRQVLESRQLYRACPRSEPTHERAAEQHEGEHPELWEPKVYEEVKKTWKFPPLSDGLHGKAPETLWRPPQGPRLGAAAYLDPEVTRVAADRLLSIGLPSVWAAISFSRA